MGRIRSRRIASVEEAGRNEQVDWYIRFEHVRIFRKSYVY